MSDHFPKNPKLSEAMDKIEAICKEYDLGAYVSLVAKDGGKWRIVAPAWACLKMLPVGMSLHFNVSEARERIELTFYLIKSIGHTCNQMDKLMRTAYDSGIDALNSSATPETPSPQPTTKEKEPNPHVN